MPASCRQPKLAARGSLPEAKAFSSTLQKQSPRPLSLSAVEGPAIWPAWARGLRRRELKPAAQDEREWLGIFWHHSSFPRKRESRFCATASHRSGTPACAGVTDNDGMEKNKTRSGASRLNAWGNHEMRGAAGSRSSPRGPSHGQRPEVPPSKCMSRLVKAPALTKGQKAISREHSEWT